MNQVHPHHIDVVIVTTSGVYPATGADQLPINQPVRVQLARAAANLGITDTAGWIARVGGVEIDANRSYEENSLDGSITIDYGPREGGGGCTS